MLRGCGITCGGTSHATHLAAYSCTQLSSIFWSRPMRCRGVRLCVETHLSMPHCSERALLAVSCSLVIKSSSWLNSASHCACGPHAPHARGACIACGRFGAQRRGLCCAPRPFGHGQCGRRPCGCPHAACVAAAAAHASPRGRLTSSLSDTIVALSGLLATYASPVSDDAATFHLCALASVLARSARRSGPGGWVGFGDVAQAVHAVPGCRWAPCAPMRPMRAARAARMAARGAHLMGFLLPWIHWAPSSMGPPAP